jgi:hypothetical protein
MSKYKVLDYFAFILPIWKLSNFLNHRCKEFTYTKKKFLQVDVDDFLRYIYNLQLN